MRGAKRPEDGAGAGAGAGADGWGALSDFISAVLAAELLDTLCGLSKLAHFSRAASTGDTVTAGGETLGCGTTGSESVEVVLMCDDLSIRSSRSSSIAAARDRDGVGSGVLPGNDVVSVAERNGGIPNGRASVWLSAGFEP